MATNTAGEDQSYVELILPWLSAEVLITRINELPQASATTFAAHTLPVGSASDTVASGDHQHNGVYATAAHAHDGVYASTTHDHAGVYAADGHHHDSSYAALGHNHHGDYVAVPGTWNTLTLIPPIVPSSGAAAPAQYRLVGDEVCLRGWLTSTALPINDGDPLATLPEHHRPARDESFRTAGFGLGDRVDVTSEGIVRVVDTDNGGSVSLSGICFSTQ